MVLSILPTMALQLRDLSFHYASGEGQVAVRELAIRAGEAVAVVGPSGAGKTTLLRLIAGILEPQSGAMSFEGRDLRALSAKQRREFRLQRMGVVFQDFALLDYLTVAENLILPLSLSGGATAAQQAKARSLAEQLEIARYWDQRCGELSQGERQRVAIVRALVHNPMLILADEPTASLDARRKDVAARLLLNDARERGAMLLMVTHDPELLPLFDRVVNLEELAP
jgi:putative ABC transport system ATP-binding protein